MKSYKIFAWRTVKGTDHDYPAQRFMGYSKREAIRLYREMFNLKGVKLNLIIQPTIIN
ncbi:TPA: hypothetical protein ACPKBW_000896 [Haemophilus influenzae]|uniref:hypothetical protein n=1 Tax=Haemophilus influenzae TaxID=727 RepID=UPI000D4E48B0|nr:hypothetical protein [Haemophilus influenzae]MCK8883856.1 hypothetical protein [Haemophilus influenzae]PRI45994.1 hypothetical protein BVZ71_01491 [Haemophilus influenzae]PRM36366.1 hypothetical protein BVZ73_01542 [Haemophilus influenzae]